MLVTCYNLLVEEGRIKLYIISRDWYINERLQSNQLSKFNLYITILKSQFLINLITHNVCALTLQ